MEEERKKPVDPHDIAVDKFTWSDNAEMALESMILAKCSMCSAVYDVEPDASDYDCFEGCGTTGSVTSPLVKLGMI